MGAQYSKNGIMTLDELKAGRLSISEMIILIVGIGLIFASFNLLFIQRGYKYSGITLLSILLLIPLFLLYPRIYRSSKERKRFIMVMKDLIKYSKKEISVKKVEKEGEKINLDLESAVDIYPKKFNMSFTSTNLGGYVRIYANLRIETKYNSIFAIMLLKTLKKEYLILEDKNLEKIIERFNTLGKNIAIYNNGGKNELKAFILGENFLDDSKKGAMGILKLLELMQSINNISTNEKPVLRDIISNIIYLPMKDDVLGSLYSATVCFKCKKLIKLWKKSKYKDISSCPTCGFDTNLIIVPDNESFTSFKTARMSNLLNENKA